MDLCVVVNESEILSLLWGIELAHDEKILTVAEEKLDRQFVQ